MHPITALMAAALVVVTVAVPASGIFDVPLAPATPRLATEGVITRVLQERAVQGERGDLRYQQLEVALEGRHVTVELSRNPLDAGPAEFRPGDRVLVESALGPRGEDFYLSDHVRQPQLWLLAGTFAGFVLLVGRFQGLWSLVGMAASLLVIIRFIIPGILSGHHPVLISIIGALAIMVPMLYLSHGVSRKTTVALIGIVLSLGLSAALASLSIAASKLSGAATEESAMIRALTEGRINAEGLLLAGIIVGALGVLDDVAVAQASTVFELRRANPRLHRLDLFRRGMNVGRDHIASTVNTLVLAYAGAALPLLILLANQPEPLGILINREFIATEVVRTLVGSIGIVAAVPATTLLAALAARPNAPIESP